MSVCESYCGSSNTSSYKCSGSSCYYVTSGADYSTMSICESYCSSNGVGEVSFYTTYDKGCGNITVSISGCSSKYISSYYTSGVIVVVVQIIIYLLAHIHIQLLALATLGVHLLLLLQMEVV